MAFNFPNNPTDGMPFTPVAGGASYTWNAATSAWMFSAPATPTGPYVQKAGDTMTGDLTINAKLNVSGPAQTGDLTVSGNLSVSGTGMAWMAPGGRLTYVRTNPRPSNAESMRAIYYVPYLHNYVTVPASASTTITMQIPAAGLANDYSDTTTNPDVVPSTTTSTHFGLFLWNNNGVLTLTRSPAINCGAGGAVPPACTLSLGPNNLLVNAAAITNGPAAGMGLYVGVAHTHQGVSYMRTSGANAGNVFGLSNYYNRLSATTQLAYGYTQTVSNRSTCSIMYASVASSGAGMNDYPRFSSSWGYGGASAVGGYSGVFLRAGIGNYASTPYYDWYQIGVPSQTQNIVNNVAGAPNLQPGCWMFLLGVTDSAQTSFSGWGRSSTEFSLEL